MKLFCKNRAQARKVNSKYTSTKLVDSKDKPSLNGSRWAVEFGKTK